MAQFARPDADEDAGSWTTTPIFSKVDEGDTGGSDSVASESVGNNVNTSNCDLRLDNPTDPALSTGHILRVEWWSSLTRNMTGHIELWQGVPGIGSLIADFVLELTDATPVLSTDPLSGAEADAITDYDDLYIRLWGRGTGGGPARSLEVEFCELEVPDAVSGPQTLSGVIGVATASGLVGSLTPGPVTAAGVIGTAIATGLIGSLVAASTLAGAISTATATGLVGSITPGPVTANGAIGTATATGLTGSLTPGPITAAGVISTATATGLVGSLAPGPATANGAIGIATATGLVGSIAPGPVTLAGVVGIATATGLVGTLVAGSLGYNHDAHRRRDMRVKTVECPRQAMLTYRYLRGHTTVRSR